MKTIYYNKKIVRANTVYAEMRSEDREYVLEQAAIVLNAQSNAAVSQVLTKKSAKCGRGREGTNSPITLLEGIIENLATTNNDFSIVQLGYLTNAFGLITKCVAFLESIDDENLNEWAGYTGVEFKEAGDRFQPNIAEQLAGAVTEFEKTHYHDLFEITVTVKAK